MQTIIGILSQYKIRKCMQNFDSRLSRVSRKLWIIVVLGNMWPRLTPSPKVLTKALKLNRFHSGMTRRDRRKTYCSIYCSIIFTAYETINKSIMLHFIATVLDNCKVSVSNHFIRIIDKWQAYTNRQTQGKVECKL